MNKQEAITKIIGDAIDQFTSSIPYVEKKILLELDRLVRDLDVDKNGNIKTTTANLKKVTSIGKKLEKIVFSKAYIKDVKEFVNGFKAVYTAQNTYFGQKPTSYAKQMTNMSIDLVVENLSESGIKANVIEPIRKLLIENVNVGGSYAELADYLRETIKPIDKKGLLSKYVDTIAVDSINTYSRAYNSIMSENAGYEWYVYRNSLKETSREFCIHMVEKRYFHKSEIPELLEGKIDDHQCKIYEATGLPYGMKSDTNERTFIMYAGGWNCGHQIVGVPEQAVPKAIVNLFKSSQESKKHEKKFNSYDTSWEKSYFNNKTGGYNVYHKDHQFTGKGGEIEKKVGRLLADINGKQVEFLPEQGKGTKVPDVQFDGKTWDIKYSTSNNIETIRKAVKNARKADNAIFYFDDKDKLEVLRKAVEKDVNSYRKKNQLDKIPDIYYMDEKGWLRLLWKK